MDLKARLFIKRALLIHWKSNNSKLKSLYTAFLHSIKLPGYRMGIKFDRDPFAVGQNNYLTKIVNVYPVYDLDAWSRNRTNNFKFKNCLFGTTSSKK